jgi:Flp pilus assembly protein TadG
MTTHAKTTKFSLKLSSALKRIGKNERGNTLMMFGAAASVVVMTGGAAVDISRRALAKEELASAVDAGALAACRAWKVSSSTTEANNVKTEQEDQAKKYIAANFDEVRYGMPLPTTAVTYPAVTGTASAAGAFRDQIRVMVTSNAEVPTTLMQVVGVQKLKISAKAECSRSQGGVELTMALDNTGSMDSNLAGVKKIVSLRSATSKMIELLYGNQETSNLVRINIIPYAMAVNIGRQVLDFDDPTTTDDNTNMDFSGAPANYQSKSSLAAFNPKSLSSVTIANNTWYGCVIEKETNNDIGLNANGTSKTLDKNADVPSDAFDVRDFASDTVDVPSGKNSGKWKPFIQMYNAGQTRPAHSGYNPQTLVGYDYYSTPFQLGDVGNTTNNGNDRGRGGCPAPTVTWKEGLTKSQLKTLVSSADYMRPSNNTYSDLGMAWAVRMMSPSLPLKSDVQYLDRYSSDTSNPFMGWVKGILLMTDGEIYTTPPIDAGQFNNTSYTGYGWRQVGNKIKGYNQTLPGAYSSLNALNNDSNAINNRLINSHEQRLLMACKQARKPVGWDVASNPYKDADAIRVYTVFFGSTSSSKAQLYRDCAGKDGFFINATNDSELNNAFSNIASDLQNLRLSL